MRIRSVKPDFWRDRDTTGRWPIDMKLVYVGLWCVADDEGRLEFDPDLLAADLDPFRTIPDLMPILERIRQTGCLVTYETEGKTFGFLPNFKKHQKPNKPSPSRLPAPPKELPEPSRSAPVALPPGEEGRGGEKDPVVEAPVVPKWPVAAAFRKAISDSMVRVPPYPVGGNEQETWAALESSLRDVPLWEAVELCRDVVLNHPKDKRPPGSLAYFAQVLADEAIKRRNKPKGNGLREFLGLDADGKAQYAEAK